MGFDMLLAIDAGNSNITVGCVDGGGARCVFRMASDIKKTEFEYASAMKNIFEFNDIDCGGLTGAAVSSVVPPLTHTFARAARMLCGADAVVVGAGIKTGLNILIDDPAQLGSDMVAAAVAARAMYEPPVIVVDMGTATKLFVVTENAGFIGGAIYPGVSLSMDALSRGTAQLPGVPIEAPKKCISANTIDCMKSGAIFGSASMIDGMCERFERELGRKASVVATGGLAGEIYAHCTRKIIYEPNLVLLGLAIIYEKNRKNSKAFP